MADDILFSFPEACSSCETRWHIMHVWGYDDGSYSICDEVGDHEEAEPEHVTQLQANLEKMWDEYLQYVARTGEDPLREFNVPRTKTKKERWRFLFADSMLGPICYAAEHGSRTYGSYMRWSLKRKDRAEPIANLPDYVKDYVGLSNPGQPQVIQGYKRLADFADAVKAGTNKHLHSRVWFHDTLINVQPVDAQTLRRQLRRAAKDARAARAAARHLLTQLGLLPLNEAEKSLTQEKEGGTLANAG